MPYNEFLADRIRNYFEEKKIISEEKKMMGGLCFMVDGKMCVGVVKDDLMARIGKEKYEAALQEEGAREMDFTKRPMKGYVFVNEDGYDLEEDLIKWLEMALAFNPLAKSSKKKR